MKKNFLYTGKFIIPLIIFFILFSGCNFKYDNYFNQDEPISLHLDSYLMLKLLQKKNKKFNVTNINNPENFKNDPFKKLLNKNDYVKDLEITPKDWDKTGEYNNSYYNVNEKYKKYLIDPWDDILLKALYADILGFDETDFNKLSSLKTGLGDYTDTHIFLALLILKENKGYIKNEIDNMLKALAWSLINAENKDNVFTDLYAERIVFLYWAGLGNLVKKEWINIIINAKNNDMGWSGYEDEEESNPHSTGLALLSIIYFREGKNKQFFY